MGPARAHLGGRRDRPRDDRPRRGRARTRTAGQAAEAALLRAADELHADAKISDDTWAALAETYDERQLIEIPMLIGQYHMVAFTLNSLGVEQDEGLEDLP